MPPGPPPKPTHLKLLEGNPGRRPLPENEPAPSGDLSRAPSGLNRRESDLWRYAIRHSPAGLLKRLDREVLQAWCTAAALHAHARAEMRDAELIIYTNFTAKPNPLIGIINAQAAIMLRCSEQLGFTPSARSRIAVKEDDAESESEARFFGT